MDGEQQPTCAAAEALAAELARARGEIEQLQGENRKLHAQLAEQAEKPVTSGPEILRRSRILAARAEHRKGGLGTFGTAVCPLCGSEKGPGYLATHIRRCHGDQLALMPAERFA